eukprot:s2213_g5.t1
MSIYRLHSSEAAAMEVSLLSGETGATLAPDEFEGKTAKAVKQALEVQIGVTRFRQRLYSNDGSEIPDHEVFASAPVKLQMVVLDFYPADAQQNQQVGQLVSETQNHRLVAISAIEDPIAPSAVANARCECQRARRDLLHPAADSNQDPHNVGKRPLQPERPSIFRTGIVNLLLREGWLFKRHTLQQWRFGALGIKPTSLLVANNPISQVLDEFALPGIQKPALIHMPERSWSSKLIAFGVEQRFIPSAAPGLAWRAKQIAKDPPSFGGGKEEIPQNLRVYVHRLVNGSIQGDDINRGGKIATLLMYQPRHMRVKIISTPSTSIEVDHEIRTLLRGQNTGWPSRHSQSPATHLLIPHGVE